MSRRASKTLARRRAGRPYIVEVSPGEIRFARYCRNDCVIGDTKFSRELVEYINHYEGGDVLFNLSGMELNFNNIGVLFRAKDIKKSQCHKFEIYGLTDTTRKLFDMVTGNVAVD